MTAREVVLAYIRWAALDEARRREAEEAEVMASIGGAHEPDEDD